MKWQSTMIQEGYIGQLPISLKMYAHQYRKQTKFHINPMGLQISGTYGLDDQGGSNTLNDWV